MDPWECGFASNIVLVSLQCSETYAVLGVLLQSSGYWAKSEKTGALQLVEVQLVGFWLAQDAVL